MRIPVMLFLAVMLAGILPEAGAQHFMVNDKVIDAGVFDREIEKAMNDMGIPGVSLAIIDNNRIAYYNSYGYKGLQKKEKVNKRTIFEGCSLSKSLLAFVAYQLVEEGKLDLDKPLYQYLGEYEPLKHDSRYKAITGRMVLSHSSGIENHQFQNNSQQLEILSTPGEKFIYSGEGYVYLMRVIELLLNQTYEEFVNERVIRSLELKNTYIKYRKKRLALFHKETPWNYAIGHDVFGKEYTKWKNFHTAPKGGNSFTAEDYAKLILAIFDGKHLSEDLISNIRKGVVRMDNSPVYYGPGFEVLYNKDDTIIAHGGNNPGFKGQMFFSVTKKRGIVLMANHDLGKLMAAKVCAMSVGLDVTPYTESHFDLYEQYPSPVFPLLKTYNQAGYKGMYATLKDLEQKGEIGVNVLNVLSEFFRFGNNLKVSEELLKENITLYPDAALSYTLLADVYWELDYPDLAFKNYKTAQALGFNLWELDLNIEGCEKRFADAERRKSKSTKITGAQTTIQAEDYSAMGGIRLEHSSDEGGGENIAHVHDEDWVEYNIDPVVEGLYAITLRVASLPSGHLELWSADTKLASLEIPSTGGWQTWRSVEANVHLPAGSQTLRIFARVGGVNINWVKFSNVIDDKN